MERGPRPSAYGGHGPTIVREAWALAGTYTLVLALRTYVRLTIIKGKGVWALIWAYVAWALGIATMVVITIQALDGAGNHVEVVDAANIDWSYFLLMNRVYNTMQPLATAIARFSVVAYLLDVQGKTHKRQRWALIGLVGFAFVFVVASTFVTWFQCAPVTKLWRYNMQGVCYSSMQKANYAMAITSGSIGIFTDLCLALCPIYIIWGLKMNNKNKLLITALMGMGVFSAVCGIVKVYTLKLVRTAVDAVYDEGPLYMWSAAELWVVLLASSMPALWPLTQLYTKRRAKKSTAKSSQPPHSRGTSRLRFGKSQSSLSELAPRTSSQDLEDNSCTPSGRHASNAQDYV